MRSRIASAALLIGLASLLVAAKDRKRLAEPAAAAQQGTEAAIKLILKEEYSNAQRDLVARKALARKLLQLGISERRGSVERYVCLREARDTGAKSGDYKTALEAVDRLVEEYEVDAIELKANVLETARRFLPSSDDNAGIADLLMGLVEESVAVDRYEVGIRLASTLVGVAEKARSTRITSGAREKKKWVLETKAEYERIEKVRAALARNPADSAANLAMGKFLCFAKGDWPRGLPLLDRGSEAALNTMARLELEPHEKPSERSALADRWWDLASGETGILKSGMEKRAIHWYQMALPDLPGVARVRVEKIIDKYRVGHPGSVPKAVYLSNWTETSFSVGVGTLGKRGKLGYAALNIPTYTSILVNGQESPNGISMHARLNGTSYAVYLIDSSYREFSAEAALVDGDKIAPRTPLTFKVVGDGKTLWSSKPVTKIGQVERCQVRVAGVNELRLEVDCPGSNHRAHAVWLEPALEPW